ncbi:ankyrin [Hyaloscypha bicolor E]|uniref:Ankyrin n=1 Tax=Hyaloscypha bicolor E TaxID=1095630 RepID=A0A2J6SJ81_9HELO|nr:ankyrin [Hyaloscypha bicolor E]PMD50811.1 ankyrin [Hyaloscypha bicolor E]
MSSPSGSPNPQRPRSGQGITRFFRKSSEGTGNSPVSARRLSFPPPVSPTPNNQTSLATFPITTQLATTGQREKAGLWEWPAEDKNEPDTVYIIAVHGLQGDWEKTWEADGKVWLRDFLGKKIDRIHVLSFGYNSIIASSGWEHELEHFSAQLLQEVKNHVDTEQKRSRPIIFLGHSLGGLIIKKALILAHNKRIVYSDILDRTAGLIFMGAPHRGSDKAKWASMLKELFNTVGVGSSTQLLADLKRQSRTLVQINSDFVERGAKILRILSFYEMYTTDGLMSRVVDEDTATLGLPNEIQIGLNADHRAMCRFSDENSQAFSAVWRPIRDMVNFIRKDSLADMKRKQRDILDTLRGKNAFDFDGPSSDFTQPTKGTCQWICSTPNYIEWNGTAQRASLLWVTGSPGSGKTFLSNFIAETLNKDHAIVCKYSFTGDKSTPFDFLRSMVSQALAGNNFELCHYAIENWDATNGTISWDSLWSFWTKICEGLKVGQIFWVIDALDELNDLLKRGELLRRLISILPKLNRLTDSHLCFRILLTSRPEIWRELPPSTEQETHFLSRIILENEPAIEDDIRSFIRNEVQMLAGESMIQKKDIEKLQALLCKGADRTFIWPQLTLQAIRNDPEPYSGSTWDLVLQSIPSDLEGLYEKLLSQLSMSNNSPNAILFNSLPPRTKKLLQFVLAAQGRFTVSELNMLLALESKPDTISLAEKEADDIGRNVEQRVYGSFLRPVTDTEGVSHVRLFHDTARKHLLLPSSRSKYAMELPECHLELAKGCISYLWLDSLGEVLSQTAAENGDLQLSKRPLLRYASLNWSHHVRESEDLMDKELFDRVLGMYKIPSQRYRNWTCAYWRFSSRVASGSTTTPLQMCAYNGHSRALRQLLENIGPLKRQGEIDQKDTAGNTALHYRVDSGSSKTIDVLLEFRADSTLRNNSGLAALHKAVIANEEPAVLALLGRGANVDIRTDGEKPGRTVLHLAAESGLQAMVELLVDHGANIEILDSTWSTAAKIAFDKGHGAIFHSLDSKQLDSGITDLDRAIIDGDESLVRTLVEGGASLSSKDNRGSTPLHRAARGGIAAIMGFLLEATSITEIQDEQTRISRG